MKNRFKEELKKNITQEVGITISDMTMADLAAELQFRIDTEIGGYNRIQEQIRDLTNEIEGLERHQAQIVFELEPVESLVFAQNPQLQDKFLMLKKMFEKETNEN